MALTVAPRALPAGRVVGGRVRGHDALCDAERVRVGSSWQETPGRREGAAARPGVGIGVSIWRVP